MSTRIVGVADCIVSADDSDSLTTYALGSCIAVTMYDPVSQVGGLLHFLLPDQALAESRRALRNAFVSAETGIPEMIDMCVRHGAVKHRLRVCAAGGASVVPDAAIFKIGLCNQVSLKKVLLRAGLLLEAEALGGKCWRSVRLDIGTSKVWVKEGEATEVELVRAVAAKKESE